MPQLRKNVPTALGVAASVFRLEALTFERGGKVGLKVAAYLSGADLATAEPAAIYQDTLPADGALAVRQASKAQFETVAMQQWRAMRPEMAGATEEP